MEYEWLISWANKNAGRFIAFLFFFSFISVTANNPDSLIRLAKKEIDPRDTAAINLLNHTATTLYKAGRYDEGEKYALQTLGLLQKKNDNVYWWGNAAVKALANLGLVSSAKGNNVKALLFFINGVRVAQIIGNTPETARLNGLAGVMNDYLGNYPEALKYYFKALRIDEQQGRMKQQEAWLGNIGTVYFMQRDFKNALHFYEKALQFSDSSADKTYKTAWLDNIGNVLQASGEHEKALGYYFSSLKEKQKTGNIGEVGKSLANIGVVYSQRKDYDNALLYMREALQKQDSAGDYEGAATDLGNIGGIYLEIAQRNSNQSQKLKQLMMAEDFSKRALEMSNQRGLKSLVMEHHKILSKIYQALGKFEKALQHYVRFSGVRDSLSGEENIKKQTQVEMNFEFEKKQATVKASQDQKDLIATEEREKQVIIRNSLIAGFGLAIVLIIVVLKGYRNKQKANLIIRRQKEDVELAKLQTEKQKKLVEEKQTEILDSIRYAGRIQRALITHEKYIEKTLNNLKNRGRSA